MIRRPFFGLTEKVGWLRRLKTWVRGGRASGTPSRASSVWSDADPFIQISPSDLAELQARVRGHDFGNGSTLSTVRPLFSVLMTICSTEVSRTIKAVQSLRMQSFDDWELFIVEVLEGSSWSEASRVAFAKAFVNDPRVHWMAGNVPVAGRLSRLRRSGRWVAEVSDSGFFSPHALLEVADALIGQSTVGAVRTSDSGGAEEVTFFSSEHLKEAWNGEGVSGGEHDSAGIRCVPLPCAIFFPQSS